VSKPASTPRGASFMIVARKDRIASGTGRDHERHGQGRGGQGPNGVTWPTAWSRIPPGQVERHQRGVPGRTPGPVDGDSRDASEAVEGPAGQHLVPRRDAVRGIPDGIALDGPGRPELRRVLRRRGQVEQERRAWPETTEPRMFGVPAAYFQGSALYSTWFGEDPSLGDHVTAVQEGSAEASSSSRAYNTPTPR